MATWTKDARFLAAAMNGWEESCLLGLALFPGLGFPITWAGRGKANLPKKGHVEAIWTALAGSRMVVPS